jgi:hypothetical protein
VVDHLKKEKNKMAKFNYRKWVTDYKTNKKSLFEQNLTGSLTGSITGSVTGSESDGTETWYQNDGCSPCEGGYVVSGSSTEQLIVSVSSLGNICTPTIEGTAVEVPTSIITSENPGANLGWWETNLDFEEFSTTYANGSSVVYSTPDMGYTPNAPYGCVDADNITYSYFDFNIGQVQSNVLTLFQGVCCDTDSPNYGQTNIPNYNVQLDEQNALDNSLMFNSEEGAFCDNSVCQESVDPEPEPQPLIPDKGNKLKDKSRARDARINPRRRTRPIREIKKIKKSELKKLIKEQLKKVANNEFENTGPYCCDTNSSDFGFNAGGDDFSEQVTSFVQNMETLNILTGNEMIGQLYSMFCDESICGSTGSGSDTIKQKRR